MKLTKHHLLSRTSQSMSLDPAILAGCLLCTNHEGWCYQPKKGQAMRHVLGKVLGVSIVHAAGNLMGYV